jgi:predicted ATPase
MLRIKDAPFSEPILAKFASDGTLKMLSYLTVLYDPQPPQLVGIEDPENHLHPRILVELAEECRAASERTQLMVTSHSPFFVNGLLPPETWILYRDEKGFTQGKHASEIQGIKEFMEGGALLGELWSEGYFGVGDPLTHAGNPIIN